MADASGEDLPLVRRFPVLASLPRVSLGRFPTAVEPAFELAPRLWIKRDDLTSDVLGGNKVRPLEFLLAGVRPGEHVVTAGARGSTHALATATHARRLGARVTLLHWSQEMNESAERAWRRSREVADRVIDVAAVPMAYLRGWIARARGAHWIPPGGSTPLGALGHVNAALELAQQVSAGEVPLPARIVLPLGSGGTAAGLLTGIAVAGLPTEIVVVRVVPEIVGNRRRVLSLARRTHRLLRRLTGSALAAPNPHRLRIIHSEYGGGYGRATTGGRTAVERYRDWSHGRLLDLTYSAKALAAALTPADAGETLFWLTYDDSSPRSGLPYLPD